MKIFLMDQVGTDVVSVSNKLQLLCSAMVCMLPVSGRATRN